MLQKLNNLRNKKGFTLVELIVVLVILAILAAILIPSLSGYIQKANDRANMAEARSALMACQTLASESYGKNGAPAVDPATAKTLAEVPGTISNVTFAAGGSKIATMTYSPGEGEANIVYTNGIWS